MRDRVQYRPPIVIPKEEISEQGVLRYVADANDYKIVLFKFTFEGLDYLFRTIKAFDSTIRIEVHRKSHKKYLDNRSEIMHDILELQVVYESWGTHATLAYEQNDYFFVHGILL